MYIYIYISLDDSHRFITVVYEKYPDKTYIPTFRLNKKRIIFVGQVFSTRQIYTLGSEGGDELALTPTLVFNKAKTRIVKLNLNCIIIQLCPSLLSFLPCIYSVRFPSSIPSLSNNPSTAFAPFHLLPATRDPRASPIFSPFPRRIGVYTPKRKRKRDYKLAGDTSTHRASPTTAS